VTDASDQAGPKVSVIIPTYNHRAYIEETLESVFRQSHASTEIIVVNDGSPDDVAQVLRPLVEAKRIRYVEQANQGQSVARNTGLQLATGDFIAFLDDDDLWPPDKLEGQLAFFRSHPDAIAVAGPAITNWRQAHGFQVVPYTVMSGEQFFRGNPITSPGQTLVRADVLRRIGGFDAKVQGAEDFDMWMRLQKEGAFYFGGSLALFYRVHEHNMSRNTEQMFTATSRVLEKHLTGRPLREHLRLRRTAYRFLDGYKGEELRKLLWLRLRTGHVLQFWHLLYRTRAYWLSHLVDPRLTFKQLFR
jgi:glycosyltransferase involved in cell wall biosynthesis